MEKVGFHRLPAEDLQRLAREGGKASSLVNGFQLLSEEERKEIARRGGLARAENARRKKEESGS